MKSYVMFIVVLAATLTTSAMGCTEPVSSASPECTPAVQEGAQDAVINNLLLNPGAEQEMEDEPSIWFRACIPAESFKMWWDTGQAHSGQASLAIENNHVYAQRVCNNWAQTLKTFPCNETLILSGYLKTADAEAVNLCLQCWDDSGEKMLAFTSTPVFQGDQDWTFVEADPVEVPGDTASIMVRAVLTGKGKVWFDDLKVTVKENGPIDPLNSGSAIQEDLAEKVSGEIIGQRPVDKDVMILSYLPQWAHGEVDNLGIEI
ncbi:MAG: hypothetical protein KJ645_09280, partial [Planctomycetes bacterium]|nr:hypothetical protein [Planctomycetota bacterium]